MPVQRCAPRPTALLQSRSGAGRCWRVTQLPEQDPPADIAGSGLPARRAALALVEAALSRRGGFEEAMNQPPYSRLTGPDRSFARMLASTMLRGLGQIDALLDRRLKDAPPPQARALLRLGAAQILFGLAPAFAAVSTTLTLAEESTSTQRFKGLMNAILRGLDRDGGASLLTVLDPSVNVPAWLLARWRAAHGEAACAALCRRTPKNPEDADAIADALEGVLLPSGSIRTSRRGDVAEFPGYDEGVWWVQDAAAAIPARLLDIRPGQTALDMCAAPGGKTLQLAAAGARVTALDRSPKRLARVSENLARTGLDADLVTGDAGAFDGAMADGTTRTFDAVLLDAPCSATGTFRRHPDVLWGARPADIAKLAGVQARMLDAAARLTHPGSLLVYSVCSLEPEEGEAQAAGFLTRHTGFERLPIKPGAYGLPSDAINAEGDLRLLPGAAVPEGGQDGFFAARFIRRK